MLKKDCAPCGGFGLRLVVWFVGWLLACFLGFYRYKVMTKHQSVGLWKVCVLCDAILEGFFYIQIWA